MSDQNGELVELAEQVRAAVVQAAVAAYEEAGMQGLCLEGRFEYAIDRARHLDVSRLASRRRGDIDRA